MEYFWSSISDWKTWTGMLVYMGCVLDPEAPHSLQAVGVKAVSVVTHYRSLFR